MVFLFLSFALVSSTDYYVSVNGNDANPGSVTAEFLTLDKALEVVGDNDNVFLREGRYETGSAVLSDVSNVKISAVPGAEVILDATQTIQTTWVPHNAYVWKTQPNFPVWQLFLNDTMVGLARFPNAKAFGSRSWNRFKWRTQDSAAASDGTMVDYEKSCEPDEETLAGQGRSFDGCVATLNVGHWVSVTSLVSGHTAGSNTFTYENPDKWWFTDAHYMIECLAALDAPGEWGYDWESNTLYLYPENGENPNEMVVRGKTNNYILMVSNSDSVEIRDVKFFGGGLLWSDVTNSLVENVEFDHPSYNMRALGEIGRASTAVKITRSHDNADKPSNNIFRNNVVQYTDGAALELVKGYGDVIENNEFRFIDYSAAYATGAVDFLDSFRTTFRRNTVDTTGSSETVRVGPESRVEYNYFRNGGLLQEDGAAVQVPIKSHNKTVLYRNWAEDGAKLGFRFDTPHANANMGYNGRMEENVAFNNRRGLSVKADKHKVLRNTAVVNAWAGKNDLTVYNDNLGNAAWQYNWNTETEGNLADRLSGVTNGYTPINVPGTNWNGYVEGGSAFNLLRDPLHGDYRPKESSLQFGAYAADVSEYWIPGPQASHIPTHPLPAHDSTDVPIDVDLKWQTCSECTSYDVYFGTDSDSLAFLGSQTSNIFDISFDLVHGEQYFWQVRSEHEVGAVWSFTVADGDVTYSSQGCDDLNLVVAEMDALRIALNQGGNGWQNWCSKPTVQAFYESSTFLKTYSAEQCETPECGRAQILSPICDLRWVAGDVMGRSKFLGTIAADLNQPHCFGDSTCGLEDNYPSFQAIQTPASSFEWAECSFDVLYAEAQQLMRVLSSESAWGRFCSDPEVGQHFLSTKMLATHLCSDEEILSASTLAYGTEWFGEDRVMAMRDCWIVTTAPTQTPSQAPTTPLPSAAPTATPTVSPSQSPVPAVYFVDIGLGDSTCKNNQRISKECTGRGNNCGLDVCQKLCLANDECSHIFLTTTGRCHLFRACDQLRTPSQSGVTFEKVFSS